MDDDIKITKVGAIAAFLDSFGVGGNLSEKAKILISILDHLEKKFTSTNKQSIPCLQCDEYIKDGGANFCPNCGNKLIQNKND